MRDLLISVLKRNARLSNEELAVMLGKSAEEIGAEIKQLEDEGVIKGYSAVVNEDLLKKEQVTAIIELRVTPQKDSGYEDIARKISSYEEVESCSLMAGAYDFSVVVKGANVKEISMFVSQRLAPLAGVLSTATYFVLKNYKDHGIAIEGEEKDERGYYAP